MPTKRNARKVLKKLTGELTFGDLLLSIREGEGWSQVEMAARIGISRSHLCDIEKNRKVVSPGRAARFAKELGYSESQFVRLALQAMVREEGLKLTVSVAPA